VNTQETRDIVRHIDDGVERIRDRINTNTWIFSVVAVGVAVIGIVTGFLIWQGGKLAQAQERNYALAKSSLEESAKANAKLEAVDEIYMTYIKSTVGQILDKLQRDNPQLKVPQAPNPRPAGIPAASEAEMERPRHDLPPPATPQAAKTPAPTTRTRVVVKYRKPKPTPKPKVWYNFFKQTR